MIMVMPPRHNMLDYVMHALLQTTGHNYAQQEQTTDCGDERRANSVHNLRINMEPGHSHVSLSAESDPAHCLFDSVHGFSRRSPNDHIEPTLTHKIQRGLNFFNVKFKLVGARLHNYLIAFIRAWMDFVRMRGVPVAVKRQEPFALSIYPFVLAFVYSGKVIQG